MPQDQEEIKIIGAREKNLKNVNIKIPKNKITAVVGVSGSGKSALAIDTVAAESQRQLNETYSSFIRNRLPHYGQPDVDSIENLSVSIVINQKRLGEHIRSTVGTVTDLYALLRLLFSRAGIPFVGYSDVFSFNNPKGMCERCQGLGKVQNFRIDQLLDMEKSLNEGAILFPTFYPGGVRWKRYVHTGLFDNDKKLKHYTQDELDTLLYESGFKPSNPTKDWPPTSLYEGVIPRIKRTFSSKVSRDSKRYQNDLGRVIFEDECPACSGSRLNPKTLSCRINGKNISECAKMPITDLIDFIKNVNQSEVQTVKNSISLQLSYMVSIGLGYLTLDRATSSLSGGESQRIKMVRQLGSSLTGLIYIFDEPSIGLHPHDINRINKIIETLKEKGNTILIVEHDPDIIKNADWVIEIGPESGQNGGQVMFKGNLEQLLCSNTLTARYLQRRHTLKDHIRSPRDWLTIKNASLHNLVDISVKIPHNVMTVVTGVAGSGKSTLINRILPKHYPDCVVIDQKAITASKRSNIATFSGIFDEIRKIFSKENNCEESLFSFNSKGACPNCKGLGAVELDLAFMDPITSVCEVCNGKRFTQKVLGYFYQGENISDILSSSVDEALDFFSGQPIVSVLKKLQDVGLGYLSLGQPLSTLSGGELQRLKLAVELDAPSKVYILDEPTTGLHLSDVDRLLDVFDKLLANGSTLIVIEHNLDVMCQADWIIDMGPGAGKDGGKIIFEGVPRNLLSCEDSITGKYLKAYLDTYG
ncbi:excinuclease ABC subunit UvrA [Bacillus sp. REN3]|uniref:ATP-binding cassette domain-containing protein n=1 Tax=Bacillus sp. REN3 TaxID=2802440 RepID=UPI001AEEEFF6|nr:excinuclease ABC subunit UvrA [Bacillus sp. REN3]